VLDARPVATLDLHGFTKAEAEPALRTFLTDWQRRAPGQVVHVITGKGRGSPGRPVLRGLVPRLVKGPLASLVAEWSKDLDEGGFLLRTAGR